MAVYKVIQDIESEDKLLGPLTLKGFLYAAIAALLAYINFRLLLVGTPIKWLFIVLFTFPMALFGVLASPLGREQPTEVWLLSRIRFFLKPRQRIWDQEGISELVTVTAPKKEDIRRTDGLSQSEVQSRLKTLATTLDTRGWAIKNVDVNLTSPEADTNVISPDSDRLVSNATLPRETAVVDVHAADDIMDEKNNPTAQKFDQMVKQADADRKQGIIAALKEASSVGSENQKRAKSQTKKSTKDLPATRAALAKLHKTKNKMLDTLSEDRVATMQRKLAEARARFGQGDGRQPSASAKQATPTAPIAQPEPAAAEPTPTPKPTPVTAISQTVNMELAQSGNDISVASIAKLANRPQVTQTGPNEVTITLH